MRPSAALGGTRPVAACRGHEGPRPALAHPGHPLHAQPLCHWPLLESSRVMVTTQPQVKGGRQREDPGAPSPESFSWREVGVRLARGICGTGCGAPGASGPGMVAGASLWLSPSQQCRALPLLTASPAGPDPAWLQKTARGAGRGQVQELWPPAPSDRGHRLPDLVSLAALSAPCS